MPDSTSSSAPRRKAAQRFWRVFWLGFLVISLGYAWYSFYVPSNDVDWADDLASAHEGAAQSGKPVLLFFTANWCVPCRIMKREVFADPEVERALRAAVIPVIIHRGEPGADEVFARYEVGGTPVTIFTDSEGQVLDYAVGGIGKTQFLEMLAKLDSGASEGGTGT